jgi:hypothetical protein
MGDTAAVSYDVYFWFRAEGNPADVMDALDDGDVTGLTPHRAVNAFRDEVVVRHPQLADVIEPPVRTDSGRMPAAEELHYLVLTLPLSWSELLPSVLELAQAHGLGGYDPQTDEPLGPATTAEETTSSASPAAAVTDKWTVKRISPHLGIGQRSLSRAWKLAALPPEVSFGQAVGALLLALALRDGVNVSAEDARRFVEQVAADCAHGVPRRPIWASLDFVEIDVTGFATSLARGS